MNTCPIIPASLRKRLQPKLLTWVLGFLTLVLVAAGCESHSESDEVFVDTYDSYFQSFSIDYNPSPDIEDLSRRSTVVVEAVLVDVEDGRFIADLETEPLWFHINLVFEADDKERYYVELPRPNDSSVDQLRSVLPIGARSVVYLQPNNDPLEGVWFNSRADGNEWFFTTPQGWILDHPERGIVFPLEDSKNESPFLDTLMNPGQSLGDWLVSEKRS